MDEKTKAKMREDSPMYRCHSLGHDDEIEDLRVQNKLYRNVLLSVRAWADAEGHTETQRICEAVLKENHDTEAKDGT